MNVKVSIIVPIYNVEKYLEECIDSILAQSLRDIEVILVDDGSTDRSRDIVDEYALKDKRIKVVHQINSGVSYSRNKGVEMAAGEYIGFVDPDDWISLNCYQIMFTKAVESSADVLICGFTEIYEKTGRRVNILYPFLKEEYLTKEEVLNIIFMGLIKGQLHAFTWNKLYKKDLLINNKITSPLDMPLMQDIVYNLKVFSCAQNTFYVNKPLYIYRRHSNSNSLIYRKDRFSMILRLFDEKSNYLCVNNIKNEKNKQIINGWFLQQVINTIILEFSSKNKICMISKVKKFNEIVSNPKTKGALIKPTVRLNLMGKFMLYTIKARLYFMTIAITLLYNNLASLKKSLSINK
ncbi:hypothetical protein CR203_16175 [Salipaludibacillus neizhouensis]|uniref:Glycosyltransferase 2-like domain-containing protein n=1 Tax=Salipaludibacillus neizhouensis TaxID=885475 RepID=A0A3A9K129_9BACI|nr:glycosyltransferase [Salipaludibacillus neizhouensis]RKL66427.1 hypothetical protein CR203_16175 [Salipaludibacillus neizhouensis]